jgi:hypothetical protein
VPGHLHDLPRREVRVDLARSLGQLAPQFAELVVLLSRPIGNQLQSPPPRVQLNQRLLEIQTQ